MHHADIQYKFLPALKWAKLNKCYDFVLSISLLGGAFKKEIIEAVPIEKGFTVADVGCGTGTLLEKLRHQYLRLTLIGVDPDANILALANEKLARTGTSFTLHNAYAESMPIPDNTLDVCFLTLTLHHLPSDYKQKALQEIHRVLKPHGKVVIADFGNEKFYRPRPLIFERREYLQDHFDGKINDFLHAAGFSITTDRTMHTSDMHLWVAEKTA